jgi:hypothetical protein
MKKIYHLIVFSIALFSIGPVNAQNTNLGGGAGNAGIDNTSIGFRAGDVVTGSGNSFVGYRSGSKVTTSSSNSFFGYRAGSETNGKYNCYFGVLAASNNTAGDYNVQIGIQSGWNNGGSKNVMIGSNTGHNVSGWGNVFIGNEAGWSNVWQDPMSNKLYITNTRLGAPLIYGDFATGAVGLGTTTPGSYRLYVNGTAYATGLWVSSDKRFKEDIKNVEGALEKISNIKGVSYRFAKNDATAKKNFAEGTQIGLIAQDLQGVFPELVNEDADGYLAVNYQGVIPVLIEAMKELKKENQEAIKMLNNQNQLLKAELASLKETFSNLDKSSDGSSLNKVRSSSLQQNTPNPFKAETRIRYYLSDGENSSAMIYIHDMNGKPVKEFDNLGAGEGEISIKGSELKAGLYYYTIVVNGEVVDTKRMLLTE